MVITTQAALDAAANSGNKQRFCISKTSTVTAVAGMPSSYWRSTGGLPAQAAIPTTGAVCTNALLGAIPIVAAQSGKALYLARAQLVASQPCGLELHDRLAHAGGFAETMSMGDQATGIDLSTMFSGNARLPGYAMVQWWIEIYVAFGATANTITVTYVDQTGATQITTVATPASAAVGRLFQIIPLPGTYIRSITTVNLAPGTLSSTGNYGVTATVKKMEMGIPLANIIYEQIGLPGDLPLIENTACLFFMGTASTTTLGTIAGTVLFVQG